MENNSALIRLRHVEQRTGLRRSHIYALVGRGLFPRPVKLGKHASAWVAREISDWIEARIASRDNLDEVRKGTR